MPQKRASWVEVPGLVPGGNTTAPGPDGGNRAQLGRESAGEEVLAQADLLHEQTRPGGHVLRANAATEGPVGPGDVGQNDGQQADGQKEAKTGVSELQVQFSLADLSSRALPPVSNAIGCNEFAVCAVSDSNEESFNKITSYAFAGVVRDKRSVPPIDKISQMLQTYVREQKQMEETLRKDRRRFRMLKVRYLVETIFYIILGLMALGIVVELVILCSRWF